MEKPLEHWELKFGCWARQTDEQMAHHTRPPNQALETLLTGTDFYECRGCSGVFDQSELWYGFCRECHDEITRQRAPDDWFYIFSGMTCEEAPTTEVWDEENGEWVQHQIVVDPWKAARRRGECSPVADDRRPVGEGSQSAIRA